MSRNSARAAAMAACLALLSAHGWAQTALTVESATAAPDEAFSLSVDLTGGASSAAGVNLRLTGQGDGLRQESGLGASQGTILSGHSTSVNTLDSLNDFRAVVYNPSTTTGFTGDGQLHTLTGRTAHNLVNGETVSFSFDQSGSAVSDASGQVLSTTYTDGVITISTPFPQTEDFAASEGGWIYQDTGQLPPEQNFFEFTSAESSVAAGSVGVINLQYRSTASWKAPDTLTPHYRDNLIAHVFTVNTNKANAFLDNAGAAVGANGGGLGSVDFRFRMEDDDLFHVVHDHGVSPGQASAVSGAGRDYVLLVDRDTDENSPVINRPIFDTSQFLNSNLPTSDIAYTFSNYRNARYDATALLAASSPVDLQGFDLTRVDNDPFVYLSTEPDLNPFGAGPLEIFWQPFWLDSVAGGFGEFFRKPTHFRDQAGTPVWGFTKEAGQENDLDRFAFFTKSALGVQVAADTIYIAEFVMNTDIADRINGPNYRVRVNLFGPPPTGLEEFGNHNEVFVLNVNTTVISNMMGQPITTMPSYPSVGSPVVNRIYFRPQPQSVGATFQFSVDFNEVFSPQTNTATGSIWLSEVRLRSVSVSNANSMALLEGDPVQ